MTEVNWRQVFGVSSLVLALMLIGGSIYLHVQQKHHFGRMHHESSDAASSSAAASGGIGVDAAVFMPSQPLQPPPPPPISTTSATSATSTGESNIDNIDSIVTGTYQSHFYFGRHNSDDDLSSGSGSGSGRDNSDSYDSYDDEEYEDFDSYQKYLQKIMKITKRVNGFVSSSASSESKSEELYDSTESTKYMPTSSTTVAGISTSLGHISEACLQCVWETVGDWHPASCNSNVLGRISRPYWLDAGKPKLEGDNSNAGAMDQGYAHCVNNAYCAGRTVSAFVNKYARDCNQDGIIDCRDHIAMHILGPTGCKTRELQGVFVSRMEKCLQNFEGENNEEV